MALEEEFKKLQEKQAALESQLRAFQPSLSSRLGRPDTTFTDILELENGHTVWARTRKMPMSTLSTSEIDPIAAVATSNANVAFPDAATGTMQWGCPVPSDWVPNTSISLNILLIQSGTAGPPTIVLRSYAETHKDGDTLSSWNLENAVNIDNTLATNVFKLFSRPFAGSNFEADDIIRWRLQRLGADAGDTVGRTVTSYGGWIEYTAFM